MAKVYLIYIDINTGYFPGLHHGLASLVASIRESGHILAFQHLSSELPPDAIADEVNKFGADVVGFSITTNQRRYLDRYSQAINRKKITLQVAGGAHATVSPMDIFNLSSINGVCIGEGEFSFVDLLNRIDSGQSAFDTDGFWWRFDSGEIKKNPIPSLEPDLSKLPLPDYTVFDLRAINKRNAGWMDMMVTRGCPYSCYYCCNHVLRSIYPNPAHYVRFSPVKHAVSIIKNNLLIDPSVRGITFSDDLLVLKKEWFRDFIEAYSNEVGLPFICNARAECITEEICQLLKKGNCACVRIGVESGNEWVRKYLLNRFMSNEQIIGAFRLLQKYKIPTFSFNIVGFPFETKEFMRQTFLLNKKLKPDWGMVYYFYPFPGTQIYSISEKFGFLNPSSEALSSYLEAPAIKLMYCSLLECQRIYYKIRVYLLSRFVTKKFGFAAPFFSVLFYGIFNMFPTFFTRLFTKRSVLKKVLRKIGYEKILR